MVIVFFPSSNYLYYTYISLKFSDSHAKIMFPGNLQYRRFSENKRGQGTAHRHHTKGYKGRGR